MKIGVETKLEAANKKEAAASIKTAGFIQTFILGVGIAGGGIATSRWQYVLLGGIWEGLISTLLCMLGYYMLNMSLAELVGIVPFAGGSFGFVRCSVGPFWGYLTACAEMCMYMFYCIRTVQKFCELVTVAASIPSRFEPVWALVVYLSIGTSHLCGGHWFWTTMLICTTITFLLLLIYVGGSFTDMDFRKYALNDGANNGFLDTSGILYLRNCYFPMWFYMGICALPLAGQRVKDAHVNVPKAMMAGMTVMAVVSILVIFCVVCQAPAIGPALKSVEFVLSNGLQLVYNVPEKYVAYFLMIPTYASATGFAFASQQQLSAMAESGMVPSIFKTRCGSDQVPVFAVLGCCVAQYAVYLVMNDLQHYDLPASFRLCCISACLVYLAVLVAFVVFRYHFEGMKRHFVSPVGVPGAVLGIAIFSQILVGLIFFQSAPHNHLGPLALSLFFVCMSLYYFFFAQYVQFFSQEEQDKFMKAYILNANKRRKTSRWVKAVSAFFMSTGLDKLFLRTSSRSSSLPGRNSSVLSVGGAASLASGVLTHLPNHNDEEERRPEQEEREGFATGTVSNKFVLRSNKVDVAMVDAVETKTTLLRASALASGKNTRLSLSQRNSNSKKSSKKALDSSGGCGGLTWSGKHFSSEGDSRRAFQLLNHRSLRDDLHEDASEEHVDEESGEAGDEGEAEMPGGLLVGYMNHLLINTFPAHFVPVASSPSSATASPANRLHDLVPPSPRNVSAEDQSFQCVGEQDACCDVESSSSSLVLRAVESTTAP